MSEDTYDRNCLCYKDDRNRRWFAAMLLSSSARFFQKSYRLKQFKSLATAINGPIEEKLDILHEFTAESLVDDIKMVICFENYMKSNLLNAGYLIHLIRPPKGHASFEQLTELKAKQRTAPVTIEEFRKFDAIEYDADRKMNVFRGLSNQTIGMGQLLGEAKYLEIAGLPEAIINFARVRVESRNNLHYLLGEAAGYSGALLDEIRQTAQFVNEKIISPFNSWCVDEGMPKKQIDNISI